MVAWPRSHCRRIAVNVLFLVLVLFLSVVSEAARLRILTNVTGGKDPEEMALFAKELSEHLGMEVELIKPPSDYSQFVQTTLRGGERGRVPASGVNWVPAR